MFTVVVITDEPLIEAGLRVLLSESAEFTFLGSFADAEAAKSAAGSHPSAIICAVTSEQDVALADLRRALPQSAIMILRRNFSPEYAHHALEMGVRGLVSSTASAESIKDCLRRITRGELWMESALSMMLLDTRPVRLSKRQSELIYLLAQGLKNKEIAGILGICEGTVKAYLTTLFEKVGAKDRFDLALFGLKHLKDFNGERILDRPLARPALSFAPRRVGKATVA